MSEELTQGLGDVTGGEGLSGLIERMASQNDPGPEAEPDTGTPEPDLIAPEGEAPPETDAETEPEADDAPPTMTIPADRYNALLGLLAKAGIQLPTDGEGDAPPETQVDTRNAIVTDDREQTNVLVLAGPGSGKTRVLVHRIAFLVRVRRENPRGILALAYNRHAAVEIRRRLRDLIGDDSNGVTVLTCHALAMRLTGASFADRNTQDLDFKQVLTDAILLLKGDGALADDVDEQRERLLAGFRWMLVDEYQDIGPEQYELISALAGRTLNDPERRLSLFAVGDDDQNVYGFAGASVEFIRRFQLDYKAKPDYLTTNYRSSANIIYASNALISHARNRMKTGRPIEIDEARRNAARGGPWEQRDPAGRGRVQVLAVERSPAQQAAVVMEEMRRLARLDPEWDWSRTAVIARQWQLLHPLFAYCEVNGIPAQRADQDPPQFWRLRETQQLAAWLSERGTKPVTSDEVNGWLAAQPGSPWLDLLVEAAAQYRLECGDGPLPAGHFREWLAEWGREVRQRQKGILLVTAHRVKGLEFDHVAVLDGGWEDYEAGQDPDASRRLYYVAMTRARKTLTLVRMKGKNRLIDRLPDHASLVRRDMPAISNLPHGLDRRYEILTPGKVDLGYAGRFASSAPVHAVLAALRPGVPLQLVQCENQWFLHGGGKPVGRLAKSYSPPKEMSCIEAHVHAVLERFRSDSEQSYASSVRCDHWEVVLPELVFTPAKNDLPPGREGVAGLPAREKDSA